MIRLAIALLRPEMLAAMDIVDPLGRILIRAGNPFQETHIKAMTEVGFGSVYVDIAPFTSAVPDTILGTEIQKDAMKILNQLYGEFNGKGELDASPVRDLASRLVNQVVLNRAIPFQWLDLRSPGEYLPAHVLNVTILAVLIGLKNEFAPARLHELAIGTLVMDIGEMAIAPEILRKTDKLTPEEMTEVKKHPQLGFDGLRKKVRGLPATSMHVAYQHHESFDGNGYPRGIGGNDIHEYARIAAVADMFDALLSDRPFRHYYLSNEAASILQAFAGKILDPALVSQLLSQVALYPQGSVVRVDTGELAEVETVLPANPSRPKLRLLTDQWGKRLKKIDSLDLTKQRNRYIVKVLKDQEIMEWVTS